VFRVRCRRKTSGLALYQFLGSIEGVYGLHTAIILTVTRSAIAISSESARLVKWSWGGTSGVVELGKSVDWRHVGRT